MEIVYCLNKDTNEYEPYKKIYYVDDIGYDHIRSYDKDDDLFKGHKIDYYLKPALKWEAEKYGK